MVPYCTKTGQVSNHPCCSYYYIKSGVLACCGLAYVGDKEAVTKYIENGFTV